MQVFFIWGVLKLQNIAYSTQFCMHLRAICLLQQNQMVVSSIDSFRTCSAIICSISDVLLAWQSNVGTIYLMIWSWSNFWSFTGWFVTKNLLWLLCHGLVTVFLIQYILRTFPSCASIGLYLKPTLCYVFYNLSRFGLVLWHNIHLKLHGYFFF